MGRQFKGPFSGFVGKTGGLVGRYVKGQFVITSLPIMSNKPPTQLQLNQQFKFGLIAQFCSYLKDLIDVGFAVHKVKLSAMNAAVAYNLDNAITGSAPVFDIDYSKFSYSRGKLYGGSDIDVATVTPAKLKFTWVMSENAVKLNSPTDQAALLIYNPVKNQFVTLTHAALRSALTRTVTLPVNFVGDNVNCWIAFSAVDGVVSNSQYIGSLTVL